MNVMLAIGNWSPGFTCTPIPRSRRRVSHPGHRHSHPQLALPLKRDIQPGDKIIQLGRNEIPIGKFLQTQEAFNADHALPLVVERSGGMLNLSITPRWTRRKA